MLITKSISWELRFLAALTTYSIDELFTRSQTASLPVAPEYQTSYAVVHDHEILLYIHLQNVQSLVAGSNAANYQSHITPTTIPHECVHIPSHSTCSPFRAHTRNNWRARSVNRWSQHVGKQGQCSARGCCTSSKLFSCFNPFNRLNFFNVLICWKPGRYGTRAYLDLKYYRLRT